MSDTVLTQEQRVLCERLLTLQKKYELGQRSALLLAIDLCAHSGCVMPKWVAEAYTTTLDAWNDLEYKTLDEAFGVAWPKGKHFAKARQKKQKGLYPGHVFGWINCRSQITGEPIDNEMFYKAAQFFGSNKTDVAELYASGKRSQMRSRQR